MENKEEKIWFIEWIIFKIKWWIKEFWIQLQVLIMLYIIIYSWRYIYYLTQ